MWSSEPKLDGVYTVEDSVVGLIRTNGPVITLHGAWAQNIGEQEMYIDFMGTKPESVFNMEKILRFTPLKTECCMTYSRNTAPMIISRMRLIPLFAVYKQGKNYLHIDTAIITAKMMQAIYDSANCHREIIL